MNDTVNLELDSSNTMTRNIDGQTVQAQCGNCETNFTLPWDDTQLVCGGCGATESIRNY